VDLATERRHAEFVRRAIADGQLTAVHDISDGGLLIALAEMALAGGRGARLDRTFLQSAPLAGLLFGEDQGRYLVTTSNSDPVVRAMADNAIAHSFVGSIAGDSIDLRTGTVSLTDLRTAHESFFPKLMGPDAALA
jgi:phosphoribosylformylglycinamidine synthase